VGTDMAADAITLFTQKAPKLVMANVAAEGLDAFKMFVQMKKVPDRGGVRFLGMCLKTAKDLINQCRGTGYIEVVTKPFTADYIKSTFVTVAAEEVVTEMKGDIYVIQCNSHNFRKAISSILREVDTAAEEGYLKVMFNLTAIPDNELDDLTLWGTIAEKTNSLGLSTSFLSQSPEIVEKLKGLVDTQDLIVTTDEGEAFEALAA